MANLIEMPKLSDTMDKGVIVAWKKREGDRIEPGEVLAEVESDKATMELEAFDPGVLRKILAGPGAEAPVGAPLAVVTATANEDISAVLAGLGQGGKTGAVEAGAAEQAPGTEPAVQPEPPVAPPSAPQAQPMPQGPPPAGIHIIEMPKLSDTMSTGTIVAWMKKEGEPIKPGDVIAEVESDKATMELEAFDGGTLRKIIAQPGTDAPVGAPLAIVTEHPETDISAALAGLAQGGKPGAVLAGATGAGAAEQAPGAETKAQADLRAATAPVSGYQQAAPAGREPAKPAAPIATGRPSELGEMPETQGAAPRPEPEAAPAGQAAPMRRAPQPEAPRRTAFEERPAPPVGHVSVSPLAARLVQEWGLDLGLVKGSGPGGRIIKRDVEQARAEGTAVAQTRPMGMIPTAEVHLQHPEAEYEDIPNSSMRKVIAQRLSESKSQIPHYYVTVEIDMVQTMALRKQLNALDGVKVSINDFILKAAALALEKHPLANASFQGDHIRVYHRVDIGMAVAMEDGLITPVIRDINHKGLLQISRESRELADRARHKKLRPEEYTGSTFTVSNLGMQGVKQFTGVINPPEAAIMAVGATREVPVVVEGQIKIGYRMDVTLSSDHRVLDGAQSADFLKDFKYFLENPITFAL